ncbi:hypothetical protein WME91_19665 [Sorangium sp. So ce269]
MLEPHRTYRLIPAQDPLEERRARSQEVERSNVVNRQELRDILRIERRERTGQHV